MSDPTSHGSTAADSASGAERGVSAEALRFLGSITRHLQALIGLAGLEGREAAGLYLRGGVAVGAAVVLVFFGYVFTLLFVAFALDYFARVPWVWIALGYAVLHFFGAVIAFNYARARFRTPVFRATSEEIRRDVAALRPAAAGVPTVPTTAP